MAAVNTEEEKITTAPKKKNFGFIIVLFLLVGGGLWFGLTKYFHGQKHEETDDAQVEANISPVISKISGYVAAVKVEDNQLVKKVIHSFCLTNVIFELCYNRQRQH